MITMDMTVTGMETVMTNNMKEMEVMVMKKGKLVIKRMRMIMVVKLLEIKPAVVMIIIIMGTIMMIMIVKRSTITTAKQW